nr:hypothetical protein [Tanacetum cinerariifolium]
LQVTQKDDGIFISQDKYVYEILKKFGFSTVKTANTPIETSKQFLKDAEADDVDVHLYRSMIGSLMYLTASRIFRYLKGQPKLGLWYPKDSPFDLEAYTDSDYAGASLDRKSTTGDETVYEERGDRVERTATTASSLEAEQDIGNILRTQSMATLNVPIPQGIGSGSDAKRQDTILGDRSAQTRFEMLSKQFHEPPLSRVNTLGSGEDRMQLMELMELCTRLSDRVLDLENVKDAWALEINKLKKRVKKLESRKNSKTLQLKRRLFKVKIESSFDNNLCDQENASNHGRNDQDKGISFVQEDAET